MYTADKGHADRVTTTKLKAMKGRGERIAMMTAYDYTYARLVDAAGVDAILVGDSLGQVVLGYGSTVPVTMDDMVHHTAAVSRGVERALVIGDMPFLSYNVSVEEYLEERREVDARGWGQGRQAGGWGGHGGRKSDGGSGHTRDGASWPYSAIDQRLR